MECIENESRQVMPRIDDCEVCGKNKAKYTCPRCELRTCCMECIKIHKKELECSGLRDKVKFKTLKDLNNIDLLNDYRFLEETARLISKPVKLPPVSCYYPKSQTLPLDLYRLKSAASSRGVQLHFLPPGFTRHRLNTSYLDYQTQNLFWRIDWIFPQADNITLTDKNVLDSTLLSACIHKYISLLDGRHPALSFYQAAGQANITLLMRAEKTTSNRYYILESTASLRENLRGKSIIEYPVIYLVLKHHIQMYSILTEEEEENLKIKHWRGHPNQSKNCIKPNNFLFSNGNHEENNHVGYLPSEVDVSDSLETNVDSKAANQHFKFFHQSGGRGRRKNNFRRKWNRKKNREMQNCEHSDISN